MVKRTKVVIALGANLGDRLAKMKEAAKHIAEDVFVEAGVSSRVYETLPWGITEQPSFLNAVICGITEWQPPALLNYLKSLENDLGRQKRIQNGPREIDLDIIAYGEEVYEAESLIVPHPRMHEREFVLLPMLDLWPQWKHPKLGLTCAGLLEALPHAATEFAAPLLKN